MAQDKSDVEAAESKRGVFTRWFGRENLPKDGGGSLKAFLCLNMAILLIIALLAFGDGPFIVTHFMGLLYFLVYVLLLGRLRCRGVILLSTIAIWLCFVSNAIFEYDNRRNIAVAITAMLGLLICVAMRVGSAFMRPAPPSDPKLPDDPGQQSF